MSRRTHRVQDTTGYLLHATAWRETSLIIQLFTQQHGVVALVARGAKRPHSVLRPVLSAFQPLSVSWSGVREIKTLTRAECIGILPLQGRAFMSAWYMNELLLRLLPREDPHPVLFDAYRTALEQLAGVSDQVERPSVTASLRRFEWILLQETGYGLDQRAPDFSDPQQEREIRQKLRARLDDLLDRPLLTRKVLMELYRS